jgi:hypothetical protein
MSFLAEFLLFLRQRKKLWMLPILILSLLVGGLVVVTQGSAIAPFIYTVF